MFCGCIQRLGSSVFNWGCTWGPNSLWFLNQLKNLQERKPTASFYSVEKNMTHLLLFHGGAVSFNFPCLSPLLHGITEVWAEIFWFGVQACGVLNSGCPALGYSQGESGSEGPKRIELEEVTAKDPIDDCPLLHGRHFFVLTSPGGVAVDSLSKCFLLSLSCCPMEVGHPSWHGGDST